MRKCAAHRPALDSASRESRRLESAVYRGHGDAQRLRDGLVIPTVLHPESRGRAAQLTSTISPRRPLRRWTHWARTSLPVPVAPTSRTGIGERANRSAVAKAVRMLAYSATIAGRSGGNGRVALMGAGVPRHGMARTTATGVPCQLRSAPAWGTRTYAAGVNRCQVRIANCRSRELLKTKIRLEGGGTRTRRPSARTSATGTPPPAPGTPGSSSRAATAPPGAAGPNPGGRGRAADN
jgi:hypothetical protein